MKTSTITRQLLKIWLLNGFFLFSMLQPASADSVGKWLEQTVYIPVYSHIYADDRFRDTPFLLTATLSIRNTDMEKAFTLKRVDYYDSDGQLLKHYLESPMVIAPMKSTRFIVPEKEAKGGSGAKFLVEWEAKEAVSAPIIESVMIGTKLQQGISFISTGRVIHGTPKN